MSDFYTAISGRVEELSTMLSERLPGIQDECKKINDFLRQDPAAAAMLTEEQIGIFMRAHYNVAHIEFAAPKASGGKRAIKQLAAQEIKDIII